VVGGLLSWKASAQLELTDLDEGAVERYLQHRDQETIHTAPQPGDRAAFARWLLVLRGAGAIAPAAVLATTPTGVDLRSFGPQLQTERRLVPTTIVRHLAVITGGFWRSEPRRSDGPSKARSTSRHAR
jgi:hypothetical protein